MINPAPYIRQAYYDALDGSVGVDVYKEDAPIEETGNYIVIRVEGQTDQTNNHAFRTDVVTILDIVTVFDNYIDPDVVEAIDVLVQAAIRNNLNETVDLPNPVDLQLVQARPESTTYLTETGEKKYFRKITRYNNRIAQI